MKKNIQGLIVLSFLLLSACATNFKVMSNPDDAEVVLQSDKESKVLGKTPLKLSKMDLEKEKGKSLSISKPGFYSSSVEINDELLKGEMIFIEFKKASSHEMNLLLKGVLEASDLLQEKKYKEAITILRSLTGKHPHVAVLYELLGNAYYLQGDLERAKDFYAKSKLLSPNPKIDRVLQKIKEENPKAKSTPTPIKKKSPVKKDKAIKK